MTELTPVKQPALLNEDSPCRRKMIRCVSPSFEMEGNCSIVLGSRLGCLESFAYKQDRLN